jgi:hypothetical protein
MVQSIAADEGIAASEGRVDDLLGRFPEAIVLRPSRSKWRKVLLLSLGMAAAAGWAGQPFGEGFFGLCAVAAVLHPRWSSLRLDEIGFEVTNLFGKRTFTWNEVSDIGEFYIYFQGLVVFKTMGKPRSLSETLNGLMTGGRTGGLPDSFGLTADDLAKLMIAWQKLALLRSSRAGT